MDQVYSNCADDQHHCFHYFGQSILPFPKSKVFNSSHVSIGLCMTLLEMSKYRIISLMTGLIFCVVVVVEGGGVSFICLFENKCHSEHFFHNINVTVNIFFIIQMSH